MNGKRLILAGGSGFIGTLLARAAVARGFDVVILTRQPQSEAGFCSEASGPAVRHVQWNGSSLGPWAEEFHDAFGVVNLTGRNVNCRFTTRNLREIVESRVNSARVIGEAIRRSTHPPRVWVQAAGEAIYGDQGENWCDEGTPPGQGFLVPTTLAWENAFQKSSTPRTRRVLLRIGFVLSATGGALKPLLWLARLGLGGRVGSGRQYISWIHWTDLCRIFIFALEQDIEGVFNASGPNPVPNEDFMAQLRATAHRPWSPPVPGWAVRIGAWLMRTEPQLALTGVRCRPRQLLEEGFVFNFPEIGGALDNIVGR